MSDTTSNQETTATAVARKSVKSEAVDRLREWLPPGAAVYTILRHVSRSGMSRSISCIAIDHEDNDRIYDFDYNVARAGLGTLDRTNGGVKVAGAGMDMGFHLVYSLSRTLYPDGFTCTGDRCPSNDHSNGDRDYTPHHHRDGGYALRQRWL